MTDGFLELAQEGHLAWGVRVRRGGLKGGGHEAGRLDGRGKHRPTTEGARFGGLALRLLRNLSDQAGAGAA